MTSPADAPRPPAGLPAGLPQLEETVLATTRYLEALTLLSDDHCREPSVLPGWSRGHVISHLSRNAEALIRLLTWAQSGVETPMYVSNEARDADIEAGAHLSAAELRHDAAETATHFVQAAQELDAEKLDVLVSRTSGTTPFPVNKVGGMRRTEIEIHHADLLVGYTAYDWPRDFLDHILRRRTNELGDQPLRCELTDTGETLESGSGGPTVSGHSADVAWWLLGRGDGSGLTARNGELPTLGRWL